MTDKEYIQKLLDSYLVAETTREEEKILSDYFCSHQDIPAEWQNFSVLFRGLRLAKTRTIAFHKRTFLKWSAIAAVAAGILLLLVFRFSQEPVEEQPVVAETIEQCNPQSVPQPIVEEKKEEVMTEVQPAPQLARKQRKAVRKQSISVEPMLAKAEPITEASAQNNYEERLSDPSNPYLLATAQLQDLRSRGERLDREVAMLMQH